MSIRTKTVVAFCDSTAVNNIHVYLLSPASCIGDRSCNQDAAFDGVYRVGPSACVGPDSCSKNTVNVGSNSCNGQYSCTQNKGETSISKMPH